MERMFDGFGIEMDKEITMDIVKFLTKKGVLRHNCRVRYYIDIGSNFSTDGDDCRKYLDIIRIPRLFICEDNLNSCIIKDMVDGIEKLYKFNLEEYAKENNLEYIESVALFCILHEAGHLANSKRWYDRFGEFRLFVDEIDYRWNISCRMGAVIDMFNNEIKDMDEFHKINIEYRKLSLERIADKTAIKLMKKFKYELCDMIRGKMNIMTSNEYKNKNKTECY